MASQPFRVLPGGNGVHRRYETVKQVQIEELNKAWQERRRASHALESARQKACTKAHEKLLEEELERARKWHADAACEVADLPALLFLRYHKTRVTDPVAGTLMVVYGSPDPDDYLYGECIVYLSGQTTHLRRVDPDDIPTARDLIELVK